MAVYTKISELDAADFLQGYDLGVFQGLTGIRKGVENTNYYLTTTQGRYVLTLYEKRVQADDLPFFIGLMEHLATKGLPAPMPQKAKTGQALGHLAGRPAVIVSLLGGQSLARINPADCAEVGRALAAMHLGVAGFPLHRANALSLTGWEKMVVFSQGRADEIFVGLGNILQKEVDYVRSYWPKDLPQGIIHGDLFPDNVLFNGPKLCGLIDFYFACDDFFAYDLAVCLNSWCFERETAFNITKAKALINGYSEIRPLSPMEKEALPVLSRGAALRFLLTRLHDWLHQVPDALVRPLDPLEYLGRLQFHQTVKDISGYGFAA
jgi:homoserine kinase type II